MLIFRGVLIVLSLLYLAGCGSSRRALAQVPTCTEFRSEPVPAVAPDSVPRAVLDEMGRNENLAHESSRISGRYPRNFVVIWFTNTAPTEARQHAIDNICGRVVGGVRIGTGGSYYVRLPDDGTGTPLFRAIEYLSKLPHVRFASPALLDLLGPASEWE